MRKANEQNTKQNNGITLIALVITIIVMLILVAVTISMAVNGGLFQKAGEAVGETQNAINKEQTLADGTINIDGTTYNSIDEYLGTSGRITASSMQSDLASYLGKEVNYGVTYKDASSWGEGKWEIFYADEEHIYIITKGYIDGVTFSIDNYNGTEDFTIKDKLVNYPAVTAGLLNKIYDPSAAGTEEDPYLKYSSSLSNMKATQYLLDSTKWSAYANSKYADWAIGGPTLELFGRAFNILYPNENFRIYIPEGRYGYEQPTAKFAEETCLGRSLDYYNLASPSGIGSSSYVMIFNGDAIFGDRSWSDRCRPVVRLSSDVCLTWNEIASQFDLSC